MNTHSLARDYAPCFALLLAVGCDDGSLAYEGHALPLLEQTAGDAGSAPDAGRVPDKHIPPQGRHATAVTLAEPGVTIEVAATGSGAACPQGQVYAALSVDGSELLTEYGFNELWTPPTLAGAERGCDARIPLATSAPVQFAITRFIAQGAASLEAGVTGYAAYAVRDGAGTVLRTQRDYVGPVGDSYRIDEPVGADAERWSPCSRSGEILVRNSFRVRNLERKGEGWFDMCNVDVGNYFPYVALKLAWRSCELPETAQAEAPPG